MVEPEVAFADLNTVAKLAEDMLKYVFKAVLAERRDDLEFFNDRINNEVIARLEQFVESDFAQVDYTDAIEILKNCGKTFEFLLNGALIWLLSTSVSLQKSTSKHRLS